MKRDKILERMTEIARDVFENPTVTLTDETTAADVDEWDSLTHLALISDIEDEFDIRFTMAEVSNSKNVGELIDALMDHIKTK